MDQTSPAAPMLTNTAQARGLPIYVRGSALLGAILAPLTMFLPWFNVVSSSTSPNSTASSSQVIMGYLLPPAWLLTLIAIPALIFGISIMRKGQVKRPSVKGIATLVLGGLMLLLALWGLFVLFAFGASGKGGGVVTAWPSWGMFLAFIAAGLVATTGVLLTFKIGPVGTQVRAE